MLLRLLLFIVLSVATLILHMSVEEHVEVGSNLLNYNDILLSFFDWQERSHSPGNISIKDSTITLDNREQSRSISVSKSFTDINQWDIVDLQVAARTIEVVKGEKNWDCARVVLVQYEDGKPQYNILHVLLALDGTTDWEHFHKAFYIDPHTDEVRISIQLNHSTGLFQVRDLFLKKAVENPTFSIVQKIVLSAWVVFLVILFLTNSWLRDSWRKIVPIIAVLLIAIITGTTMPGDMKNYVKHDVLEKSFSSIQPVMDINLDKSSGEDTKANGDEKKGIDITKVAHFLLFFLLGAAMFWLQNHLGMREICLRISMLACATELMQLFVEGRSALFGDVLIDLSGAASALLILQLARIFHEKSCLF